MKEEKHSMCCPHCGEVFILELKIPNIEVTVSKELFKEKEDD